MLGFCLTSGVLDTNTDADRCPCSSPTVLGLTMVRTFGNHDDELTVLGVQVLQVEGGVGNNHTRALVHPDRLQHHLWGLVVLPLHRSQGDTVRKGKGPRGNDCCLPE